MPKSEKNFENRVKAFLEDQCVWHVKFFANAYTKVGIPDLMCCCNGVFVAVEVKATHGKPSPMQLRNLKKIDQAGGYAILLYPDQFDDFKQLIQYIKSNHICTNNVYKILKERWVDGLAGESQQD